MFVFSRDDLDLLFKASFLKPSNSIVRNLQNKKYQSYLQAYSDIYNYTFFLQDYRTVCILPKFLQKICPRFIRKFFEKKKWVELPYMVCIFPLKTTKPLILWYCLEPTLCLETISFEEIFELVSLEVQEEMIFYFNIFKDS